MSRFIIEFIKNLLFKLNIFYIRRNQGKMKPKLCKNASVAFGYKEFASRFLLATPISGNKILALSVDAILRKKYL